MRVENINPSHKGLVVRLRNSNVTPDSLGPVIDNVIVTRHILS